MKTSDILQEMTGASKRSAAQMVARDIVRAARNQFPNSNEKALSVAKQMAQKFAANLMQEIDAYEKESTFVA
jgi:hypothetical protein